MTTTGELLDEIKVKEIGKLVPEGYQFIKDCFIHLDKGSLGKLFTEEGEFIEKLLGVEDLVSAYFAHVVTDSSYYADSLSELLVDYDSMFRIHHRSDLGTKRKVAIFSLSETEGHSSIPYIGTPLKGTALTYLVDITNCEDGINARLRMVNVDRWQDEIINNPPEGYYFPEIKVTENRQENILRIGIMKRISPQRFKEFGDYYNAYEVEI